MSIHDAMLDACRAVGIEPPRKTAPGRWAKSNVTGKSTSNTSGRVLIHDDGKGGIAWNWATGQRQAFRDTGTNGPAAAPVRRDPERDRAAEAERIEVERICGLIVRSCDQTTHPYLARKGFPDELGLVLEDPRKLVPDSPLGRRIGAAIPEHDAPLLIVPGRIGNRVTTVQFIAADGTKKNILGGLMGGAAHRIATGRETWVCEGIATALSVRAALRLLGRSATVLCAFSASNVAKVVSGIPGAAIAADHDKPVEAFGGLGTGEFYARKSGRSWSMPPEAGDFNDFHQAAGLRAVAVHLREVR